MAYRLKIDVTYTTTANATTALTAINAALSTAGRVEVATRTNAVVFLKIVGIETQAEAEALRSALHTAWSSVARSYGKVSLVRSDDTS
jgi:hypothetical protein